MISRFEGFFKFIFSSFVNIFLCGFLFICLLFTSSCFSSFEGKTSRGYLPVLEQFKYNGGRFNAFSVPVWRVKLAKQYNLNYDYFVLMQVITNLECGREDGNCVNSADAGPFQFNRIHTDISRHTRSLLRNNLFFETYLYQFEEMIRRIDRFNKVCGVVGTERWYRCQLGRHHGSGTEGFYAYKGLEVLKVLNKDKYMLKNLYERFDEVIELNMVDDYMPFLDFNRTEHVLVSVEKKLLQAKPAMVLDSAEPCEEKRKIAIAKAKEILKNTKL